MYWLQAHAAVVLVSFLVVVTATLILQQQRTPQSILAWLLFVMTVPYLAVPLFMALGFRKQRGAVDPLRFESSGTRAALEQTPTQLDKLLRTSGLPGAAAGFSMPTGTQQPVKTTIPGQCNVGPRDSRATNCHRVALFNLPCPVPTCELTHCTTH